MPFLVTTYGIFRVGVSGHSKRILIAALLGGIAQNQD